MDESASPFSFNEISNSVVIEESIFEKSKLRDVRNNPKLDKSRAYAEIELGERPRSICR
jgi:hypothetical protein